MKQFEERKTEEKLQRPLDSTSNCNICIREKGERVTFGGGANFAGELGDEASGSDCGVDGLKRAQLSSDQPFLTRSKFKTEVDISIGSHTQRFKFIRNVDF